MRKQSYKEKMEVERAALAAAGCISERYSGISSIEFRMIYYHRSVNPVLMRRTVTFSPDNYAGFHMKCMTDGCVDGGYDLAPIVAGLVKSGKKSVKGRIPCKGTNATPGHASLSYEVNIEYNAKAK